MGLRSAADAAARASYGCPSGGRRRRRRPGCPDACHAVRRSVRVRCPPCGRTSVQLVGWTSGVHAPGVHTTGVIRVSGRTPVRCLRPLQPRWIRNTSVRRDRPRLVHRVRRVAVVGERLGRRCPNRAWRAKMVERWPCVARTRVDARLGAASQASRPRRRARRLADQGSWSRARCRSVGGGAGEEQVRPSPAGAPKSRRCVLGGLPACWLTMGWTGRWSRCVVVELVVVRCRPALEGPSGSAESRRRPQRGRGM